MCIVPLLEHPDYSRPIGILCFLSRRGDTPIAAAHLFLLSRLAVTASGYLAAHLPFPGCPWWPDVPFGRNAKSVRWESGGNRYPRTKGQRFLRIIGELMPTGTAVQISMLKAGASGANVFRCDVKKDLHYELPRVVKVSNDPDVIIDEAKKYYRYVQNHKPGYASRIDVAKVNELKDQWGAIVYLLVGGGERAKPWSEWAKQAEDKELEKGLHLLYDQLASWYIGASKSLKSPVELLISEPFFSRDRQKRFRLPYFEGCQQPNLGRGAGIAT